VLCIFLYRLQLSVRAPDVVLRPAWRHASSGRGSTEPSSGRAIAFQPQMHRRWQTLAGTETWRFLSGPGSSRLGGRRGSGRDWPSMRRQILCALRICPMEQAVRGEMRSSAWSIPPTATYNMLRSKGRLKVRPASYEDLGQNSGLLSECRRNCVALECYALDTESPSAGRNPGNCQLGAKKQSSAGMAAK
jgi:hypothetical protein